MLISESPDTPLRVDAPITVAQPRTTSAPDHRRAFLIILAVAVALHLLHFVYAINGPLMWQPGPDEDYYRRFGMDVASGSGRFFDAYAFMDPLYGYIVGLIFKLGGGHLFPLYPVQIMVDCITAATLHLTGRKLGYPRAGLIATALYAVTGMAIAYTMAILKATWVACHVALWILFALRLMGSQRRRAWGLFGAWYGIVLHQPFRPPARQQDLARNGLRESPLKPYVLER